MGLALMTQAAQAQTRALVSSASTIAAVAGDEAITNIDVDMRLKFVFATTRFSNTPESIARLRPQVVRSLIDERLQLQEGRKNKISLTDKEVEQAIAAIENQRQIPPGGIHRMLAENHIAEDTFLQQVKAQIVWGKLLARKVRSQIIISDDEVDQVVRKLSQPVVKQELKIALLQLPVDKGGREADVLRTAQKLVLEVRGGADFEELARQFGGGSAIQEAFWVRPEQLDPAIAGTLKDAKKGDISNPLRNSLGFAIIKVYDTRDLPGEKPTGTEITFREITLKLKAGTDAKEMETLKTIAEAIEAHPGTCADKNVAGIENAGKASIEVGQKVAMLSDLPPALAVLAEGMKVGDISTPFASDEGVKLYMLCAKRDGVNAPVDRERAKNVVYQQRMELEAQKYMRNLRRDAFIDIR